MPVSSISTLSVSCSFSDALNSLYHHQWSFRDGHYFILANIIILALYIMGDVGMMLKGFIAVMLLFLLMLPVTSQFFLPFLPIATWLFLLFSSKYVVRCLFPSIHYIAS